MLNGEPVRLGGIEWMPGSSLEHGMAETHEEIQKNLELMKGMNCVYTRFHWPQDEFVLDWCDRNGILAQEEIPYWGWSTEFNDTTIALGYQYLDEMMAAHFNHPSLISWGVGNELRAHDPFFIKTIRSLVEYAKSKDPDRLANYVTNALNWDKRDNPNLPPDASSQGDMLCWNEYTPSWYEQPIENTLGNIEYVRKEYPNRPVVISEFGLCEPAFPGGDERRIRDVQYQIPTYGSVPYVAGFIYFCLNDYRTHMGEDHSYSYPQRVHGIVDINLNKKPSYKVLQALCSPIDIKSARRTVDVLNIQLRGKIGIPSYHINGYQLVCGNNRIEIPEIEPGKVVSLQIKVEPSKGSFRILRPSGYEVSECEYQ